MEWVITMITLVAGCVTIAWFIRDVRKENSKILKSMLDVQKTSLDVQKTSLDVQKTSLDVQKTSLDVQKTSLDVQNTSLNVQREVAQILVKIEEGQREGFRMLSEDMTKLGAILERVCVILERVSFAQR
ncbi:MAG: hypothetical protein AB1765_07575 [Candidatus Hydrogenedentota bacterium]